MIERDELLKEKAYMEIKKYKEVVAADPYRLHYHVMPPVGLLNDPNGFVYFKGNYHLFYQWNPFQTGHGAKFWGHYVSKDLVHWEACPIALSPIDWFDKNGCYSGSAVIENDQLVLFYTGNVRDEAGNRETYQCKAVSEDGIHFRKLGPVIHQPDGYTAHFRDPKVYQKDGMWYMVIGAQRVDETGCVLLYRSPDLTEWKLVGPLAGSHLNRLGDFGYMWECPDLLELDGQDILIVSPQGIEAEGIKYQNIYQAGYFAGKVDYESFSFDHQEFEELDRGFDFYAPQTTTDPAGRRLLFGWMGVPEENEAFHPTIANNWIHAMTLPRELTWENEKVYQRPVKELEEIRGEQVFSEDILLQEDTKKLGNEEVFELLIDVSQNAADCFTVQLGKSTKLSYERGTSLFTLERESIKEAGKIESRQCSLASLQEIRVFKDTSSIEVFLNGGEEVFTARLFDPSEQSLSLTAKGSINLNVKKWNLLKVTK